MKRGMGRNAFNIYLTSFVFVCVCAEWTDTSAPGCSGRACGHCRHAGEAGCFGLCSFKGKTLQCTHTHSSAICRMS